VCVCACAVVDHFFVGQQNYPSINSSIGLSRPRLLHAPTRRDSATAVQSFFVSYENK